ncbi:MAG: GreA/GreB family elongation factor [Bacillales bacterium]|nr:GreA/GreB family elongation factor [Bacillales bacterium]
MKLRSLKMQEDITIKIVKPNEESTFNRRYSLDSSFARALSGKAVGDVIRVNVVNGYLAYKILSID